MGAIKFAGLGAALFTCSMSFPALADVQGQSVSRSNDIAKAAVQQRRATVQARQYADAILEDAGLVGTVWTLEAWLWGTGNLTDQKLISASRMIAGMMNDGVVYDTKIEQLSGLLPDCSRRMAMGLGFDTDELDRAIATRRLESRNALYAMIEASRPTYTYRFNQADEEAVMTPAPDYGADQGDDFERALDEAAANAAAAVDAAAAEYEVR